MEQEGGALIGTGSFGWVFNPSLKCPGENENRDDTVSKLFFSSDSTKELNDFLKTEGWVTIKADNPYVHGYYFNLNSSGSISGDHLF